MAPRTFIRMANTGFGSRRSADPVDYPIICNLSPTTFPSFAFYTQPGCLLHIINIGSSCSSSCSSPVAHRDPSQDWIHWQPTTTPTKSAPLSRVQPIDLLNLVDANYLSAGMAPRKAIFNLLRKVSCHVDEPNPLTHSGSIE